MHEFLLPESEPPSTVHFVMYVYLKIVNKLTYISLLAFGGGGMTLMILKFYPPKPEIKETKMALQSEDLDFNLNCIKASHNTKVGQFLIAIKLVM